MGNNGTHTKNVEKFSFNVFRKLKNSLKVNYFLLFFFSNDDQVNLPKNGTNNVFSPFTLICCLKLREFLRDNPTSSSSNMNYNVQWITWLNGLMTMVFDFHPPYTVCIHFYRLRTAINVTKHHKNLGMIFDDKLQWAKQVEHVKARAIKRLNLLKCLSGLRWLPTKTYCYRIWGGGLRKSILDKVNSTPRSTNCTRGFQVH
jgi:hypothetical protein